MKSSATTGGLFVVSLTILMFIFNGDLKVITSAFGGLAQYQAQLTQSMAYFAILGFGAVAIRTEGLSWRGIGVSRHDFTMSLPVLVALAAGTVAVAVYTGDLAHAVVQSDSLGSTVALLSAILFATFVEEFVFRGYVQNGTARRFGVTAGILVSAAVFAVAHVPSDLGGLDTSTGLLPYLPSLLYSASGRFFFGAVAFSTVYYLTGNFFITFFTHAFYDISVLFLVPPDGSLIYRILLIGIPYAMVSVLYGRKGFPSARVEFSPEVK